MRLGHSCARIPNRIEAGVENGVGLDEETGGVVWGLGAQKDGHSRMRSTPATMRSVLGVRLVMKGRQRPRHH